MPRVAIPTTNYYVPLKAFAIQDTYVRGVYVPNYYVRVIITLIIFTLIIPTLIVLALIVLTLIIPLFLSSRLPVILRASRRGE